MFAFLLLNRCTNIEVRYLESNIDDCLRFENLRVSSDHRALIKYMVGWDGRMSRVSVSHFKRLGNLDLMGLNPVRLKPMTLTLTLVTSQPGTQHY